MGFLLEKVANHWQFRFVTIVVCLALVTYAVVMPVHSSELLTASDFGATPSAAGLDSAVQNRAQGVAHGVDSGIGSAVLDGNASSQWAGANPAAAERLREIVDLDGDSKVPRDASDAIRRLSILAKRGDVAADFLFGEAYQSGLGLPKDVLESARWYRKAIKDRKALAGADLLAAPATFEDAFQMNRNEAEAGQRAAQLYLGLAYESGIEVSTSYSEAARWYRKAAAQGSASAACNLGLMFLEGEGSPKDDVEALQWLTRAASQGSVNAQVALGHLYLNGDGVAKDPSIGAMWLERAANQGSSQAELTLSLLYETGIGVQASSAKAYMWINLASSTDPRLSEPRDEIGALVSQSDLLEGLRLTHDWILKHGEVARTQIGE